MCEYNTTWVVGVWYIVYYYYTSLLVISSMGGNFFFGVVVAPRDIKALTHAEPHYFNLVFYASVLMAIGCVIL